MFDGSTNADEMNVSGNIHMKPAELAASTEPTDRPISAWTQLKAYEKANRRNVAATASNTVPSMRKPMAKATTSMTTKVRALRTTSETVRPINTAEGYMGSDRSRSISPLLRSSARPTPVNDEPN